MHSSSQSCSLWLLVPPPPPPRCVLAGLHPTPGRCGRAAKAGLRAVPGTFIKGEATLQATRPWFVWLLGLCNLLMKTVYVAGGVGRWGLPLPGTGAAGKGRSFVRGLFFNLASAKYKALFPAAVSGVAEVRDPRSCCCASSENQAETQMFLVAVGCWYLQAQRAEACCSAGEGGGEERSACEWHGQGKCVELFGLR